MTKKDKLFLLTGTYSSLNKGDAAMQLTTAQQLKNRWPGSKILISTPFPGIDKGTYKQAELIRSSRRRLVYGTLQVVRAYLYRKTGGRLTFLVNNSELRAFSDATAVIDLSGDTITEDYGPHVTYSHLLPIMLGVAFGRPTFVCAQSIGPFKFTKQLTRWVLNKSTLVTAREEMTYQYLNHIGLRPNKLTKTADMAFLMTPINKQKAIELIRKEGVPLDKPLIGVSVSDLVRKRYEQSTGENYCKFMATSLDKIAKDHDVSVMFVSHVVGPSKDKDDRIISQEVASLMKNKSYVLKVNYRPDELKGIISLCEVFVGARMHSNIGALSSCIPTLAIGYSQKTRGIMRSLDSEKFTLDIDKLDAVKMVSLVDTLFIQHDKVSRNLKTSLRSLKKDSAKNIELIASMIE